MPLKPHIFHDVPAPEVARRVSHEFQEVVDKQRLKDGPYTVISFPGMRGESTSIVDSKVLSKALSKVQSRKEQIVAVAHNFTSEARELLNQCNAIFFFKSDFFWSDETWRNIRDKH